MRPLLVVSSQDPVGRLILSLLPRYGFERIGEGLYEAQGVRLLALKSSLLYLERLGAEAGDATDYIFLHKHSSESGLPVFTVHQPGNLTSRAPLGGRPREVALVNPTLFGMLAKAIHRASEGAMGLPLALEATHHGPTSLERPVLFVELGSGPSQWEDERLATLLLEAVLAVCRGLEPPPGGPVALAVGGPHYPEKFKRLVLEQGVRPAGIASKHVLDGLDEALIRHMLSRSLEPVTHIYVDWKGARAQHRALLAKLAAELGLSLVRV